MKVYDAFISYRRSDGTQIADALYRYLTAKGLRVFLDRSDMVDGHYFTDQLIDKVKMTPNYILIGTDDVFRFRTGEDWVRKEIEIATVEYEKARHERTVTVLTLHSVVFPEKDKLPEDVRNIASAQRILMTSREDTQAFYQVLKAVTEVNRRNLWQAAHRWLEESKQPGGRFASLHITESILPNAAARQNIPAEMPILVHDEENAKKPLLEAVGSGSRHHYLIGEGGIGKTTALMHIMNGAYAGGHYAPDRQIPIFVELSFAPDTYGALYEGGKSSFIRRAIFKQLRSDRSIKQVSAREVSDIDEVFVATPYDVAVKPITDVLSKTTPAPEYLLLLDGLNEVSSVTIEETGLTVMQMVAKEINLLLSECPNVRVILTSRSDEVNISEALVSRLYLTGIEDQTVQAYLENAGLTKEQIAAALSDENLRRTLRIPLFLTMYASLSQTEGICTQGEILKTFFSERRKNVGVYTAQERLAAVEMNVSHAASMVQKKRVDADMHSFLLDFLLPEIAWHMHRKGEFYLRMRDVRKIIVPVLTDTSDTAVCGEFGRELFSKYRKGASAKQHTYKIAREICERLSGDEDMAEIAENVVECCVFSLGILQESNGKYGFIHQHIRDYFAAVKNINTLRLSVYLREEEEPDLALQCMCAAFREEPVGYSVRRFMGEYLGEHKNKPAFSGGRWHSHVPEEKCDRTLIRRALSVYRNVSKEEAGCGLYSLLKLLEELRGVLAGVDLSYLDLSGCGLNGTGLGIPGLAANLQGAKLQNESLFPAGHTAHVADLRFSEDGSRLLSVGRDGTVKIWDTKTDALIANLHHQGPVLAACFLQEGRQVISVYTPSLVPTVNRENYITLWDTESNQVICREETIPYVRKMALSKDERYILLSSGYYLQVLSVSDFSSVCELCSGENESALDVLWLDGPRMAMLLQTGRTWEKECETRLSVWNAEDSSMELETLVPGDGVALCAAGEDRLSVFVQNNDTGEIRELRFDAHTLEQQRERQCAYAQKTAEPGERVGGMVHTAKYSENGQWFAIPFTLKVNLYAANTNSLIHSFAVNRCESVCFDSSGSRVAFGTAHGDILTYSVSSFSPVSAIQGAASNIYSFAYSPDCRYIATMGGRLELWDASTLKLVTKKNFRCGPLNVMAFSAGGDLLHNWPAGCGLLRMPDLETAVEFYAAVRFDRAGTYFATVKNDEELLQSIIYAQDSMTPVCVLKDMIHAAFLDDKAVALCDIQETEFNQLYRGVAVVQLPSGQLLQKLSIPGEYVDSVAVGKEHIAILSRKGTICVWNGAGDSPAARLQSQLRDEKKNHYLRIAFSDDGRYLLEYVREKTVIREPGTLKEIAMLDGELLQCSRNYIATLSAPDQKDHRHVMIYRLDTFVPIFSRGVFVPTLAVNMSFAHISSDETRILIREGENRVGVYRLPDAHCGEAQDPVQRIGGIQSAHGMDYQGVMLKSAHPDRPFTAEEKQMLRQYGAIVE